jgi:low affinity Fe/Cu permease
MPVLAPWLLVDIPRRLPMRDTFRVFATRTAEWVGTPAAFVLGLGLIVLWALTGPLFGFSDTWQLVVNTATTIVTFLMVFLIQNTQNRDARAIHLKLDELIRGVKGARTAMVALENATDDELAELQEEFERLHQRLAGGHTGHGTRGPAAGETDARETASRHGAGESMEQ